MARQSPTPKATRLLMVAELSDRERRYVSGCHCLSRVAGQLCPVIFAWEASLASLCIATVLLACGTSPPCPGGVVQSKREKPALPSGRLIRREGQLFLKRSSCCVTDSGTHRTRNPHKRYRLFRGQLGHA